MDNLLQLAKNPNPFEKGSTDIWLDPERAELVLKTHLDKNIPGGSKSNEFIDETINHINLVMPPKEFPKLLDLACGPGLYAEKLSILGYSVTGVDYNKNALDYAKDRANELGININYVQQDITDLTFKQEYDLCLLIYQVYGSFNENDRMKILTNIHSSLKTGGYVLLDVLSENSYKNYEVSQNWLLSRKNNLFSEKKHLTLASSLKYPNMITLAKNLIVFEDGETLTYNYWSKHFTIKELDKEVKKIGFTIEKIYNDVNGNKYDEKDDQFAVLLKKL